MKPDTFRQADLNESISNKADKWPRRLILPCGVILLVTGAAKIISTMGTSRILGVTDPIFGLSFGHLMLLAGMCELIVAMICILGRNARLHAGLLAWLSTTIMVYRIGLWYIGWNRPCSCMGNLTDLLHIPSQTADVLMKIILGSLLVGSYGTLFCFKKRLKNNVGQSC